MPEPAAPTPDPTPWRLSMEVIAVVTSFLTLAFLFAIAADQFTRLLS